MPSTGGTWSSTENSLHTTAKMNLSERQNKKNGLLLLKAQRQLYSDAKFWWGLNLIFTVVVTMLIAVGRVVLSPLDLSLVAGGWAIFTTFLSSFWFTPAFKNRRSSAARIQEQFDTEALGIDPHPMNKVVATDEVIDLAGKYDRRGKPQSDLENWYPPVLSRLPEQVATAVCQRINSRWDEKLRIRYIRLLWCLTVVYILLVVGSGLWFELTLKGVILTTMLPVFPGVKFLIGQLQENCGSTKRLSTLASHSQKRFDALREGKPTSATAREIQDEIFQHRKAAALVPDWLFKYFQKNDEESMTSYTEHLVEEIESKEEQTPSK